MLTRFVLLCGLLLSTRALWAQTDRPIPFPRWYVGLQYGRQDYQLAFSAPAGLASGGAGRTNAYRTQLTLGYQITSSLAIQAGIAPLKQSFAYGGSGTNNAGQPVIERGLSTTRSLAVPILTRYTVADKLWKNLQFDVLVGPVLFWSQGKSEFTRMENGVLTTRSLSTTQVRNAFLAAGPSARYVVGSHLAGFIDWMFYKNLQSTNSSYPGSNLGNKTGITTAVNLGIQYRFIYR
ncbi:hypothetical protein [Hymenobacter sp. UYP22]|uniref:hypothetical protein n=1 Tax=Hymenobacter sp. UYP22 TaxID=3156348 RepID=UPI003397558B